MDVQLGGTSASTTAPAAPAPALGTPWPRSAQVTMGVLVAVCLLVMASKSWRQALEAGSNTIPSQRIDLNSATHAELMVLPGVGEKLAERILTMRAHKGPFLKVDDLRKVSGIGPATMERLRDWVFVAANLEPARPEPSLPLSIEPSRRAGAKSKKGTD